VKNQEIGNRGPGGGKNSGYLNYLIPAFSPPYDSDIPLPDLKIGGQDLYQGLVGSALHGGRGQIDLHPALFFHYFILFGPRDYPDRVAHENKIASFPLTFHHDHLFYYKISIA
jgi:hypothetical protein